MTKEEFNNLIKNIDNGNMDDLNKIARLTQQFPYFQILHVIQAKIASNLNNSQKSELVGRAAIHTADRINLKHILENKGFVPDAELIETVAKKSSTEELETKPVTESLKENPATNVAKSSSSDDSSALFQEVMNNLETLKSLRKKYEFLEEKEKSEAGVKKSKPKSKSSTTTSQKKISRRAEDGSKRDTNSYLTDNDEEDKKPDSKKNQLPSDADKNKFTQSEPQQETTNLNVALKKINIDEQNIIIESFIKNEAEISSRKPDNSKENRTDLSANSTVIREDLVSENLAEIMIQQGKKDKAIEIYKKLIWKFPQKKSYFASRIEEITD